MVAVSQPVPQNRAGRGDRFFRSIVQICASLNILLLIAIVIELVVYSLPSIQKFGLDFFTKSVWNPTGTDTNPVVFGALAFIFGTIVTAVVGLIIATPLAIGASIFISEYCPPRIGDLIAFFIELLVAIPSVAYGVWGLFVLAPFMRFTVDPFLENTLGRIPVIGAIFQPQIVNGHSRPITGTDIFTAGVILAIMILPTILAVSR